MPITSANFSCSQNYGDIETLTITDTSTGSEASLAARRIYIQKANGTYLVPAGTETDYIVWPADEDEYDIEDILDKDYAVDIRVDWIVGTTIAHTKTILNLFKAYTELFLYNLTQYQASNNRLTNSSNFYGNKMKLRCLLDDAIQAVEQADDQASAQAALDAAKELTDNQSHFF